MLLSSTLLALVVSTPVVEAKPRVPRAVLLDLEPGVLEVVRARVILPDDPSIDSVSADIEVGGDEATIELTESDAWLHGAANVSALPKTEASVTVTLYDTGSASLISFSGILASDGSLTLAADARSGAGTCTAKEGCKDETSSTTELDIDVLAAEVFPAAKGYDLALDLNGADTYSIAYADVVITEGRTSTKAEFGWDEAGSVWVGETSLSTTGQPVNVGVATYDIDGNKLDKGSAQLGGAWEDGGYGVNTLATDDDPLTRVALVAREGVNGVRVIVQSPALTVVSDGWTVGSTVPAAAQIELTGGETLTVPINSYQVAADPYFVKFGGAVSYDIDISSGSFDLYQVSISMTDLSAPACSGGFCVVFADAADGTYSVSVSAYGTDATKLPAKADVEVTTLDKSGSKQASFIFPVGFDDQISAAYAIEVSTSGDPLGIDLSGEIRLLAAPDTKGKQKTLSKGKFYGSISRDSDGDLSLAGADKNLVEAKGDILIGGEPIDFELTDTNKDGVIEAPPVIVYKNGKGTRQIATASNGSPGLL